MKRTGIVAGLALLALGGLSACGSSSSKNTTATSTVTATAGLSRTELAARANTICATAQAQARKIKAPPNLASDAAAAAAYFDKAYAITDAETKELQALTPATAAAADWAAFVGAQTGADQLLLTLKNKAHAKDTSGLDDLKRVAPAGDNVARTAAKVGATTCQGG